MAEFTGKSYGYPKDRFLPFLKKYIYSRSGGFGYQNNNKEKGKSGYQSSEILATIGPRARF